MFLVFDRFANEAKGEVADETISILEQSLTQAHAASSSISHIKVFCQLMHGGEARGGTLLFFLSIVLFLLMGTAIGAEVLLLGGVGIAKQAHQ
jgi:hypothetical protein